MFPVVRILFLILINRNFVYLYIELMCLISTICTSKTHHFEYELKHP